MKRLSPYMIGLLIAWLSSGILSTAAEPVEETFETELGETMRCVYTAGHSAVTTETLRLWLKLRYPYQSFGFPGLEDAVNAGDPAGFFNRVEQTIKSQRRIIQSLQSAAPQDVIRPLYDAVVAMFQREHDYSLTLLELLKTKDADRFIQILDGKMTLTPKETEKMRSMAVALLAGKIPDDLRTVHEQFLNDHVMVDDQRRHFTDFHREFMRTYGIKIDCRCVQGC